MGFRQWFSRPEPPQPHTADHYIIPVVPPCYGMPDSHIRWLLEANNCILDEAEAEVHVDERAREKSLVMSHIRRHQRSSGQTADTKETRVIHFSGQVSGVIVALFYSKNDSGMSLDIPESQPTNDDEPKPFARLLTSKGIFPLPSGRYKLVHGVPRKYWPVTIEGKRHIIDAYRYEVEARMLEEYGHPLKDKTALDRVSPIEAFEIEGFFEHDGCYWPAGAIARIRRPGDVEIENFVLPDWRFRLYEKDQILNDNGLLFRWSPGRSLDEMWFSAD